VLVDLGPPHEVLVRALRGNADAIRFVQALTTVYDVWDDLTDGDPATPQQVDQAFYLALIDIPTNPFFQTHRGVLQPLIVTGMLGWWSANDLERLQSERARRVAYVSRCDPADVIAMCAALVGGMDWARACMPEVKLFINSESPEDYMDEMERKHGMAE
jgi:DNA-binding FadR family transcriptional regulator